MSFLIYIPIGLSAVTGLFLTANAADPGMSVHGMIFVIASILAAFFIIRIL